MSSVIFIKNKHINFLNFNKSHLLNLLYCVFFILASLNFFCKLIKKKQVKIHKYWILRKLRFLIFLQIFKWTLIISIFFLKYNYFFLEISA